jgi:AraC-like DNA-binding protein
MAACRAPRTRIRSPDPGLAHLLTRYEIWSPPHTGGEQERALWVLPGEARLVVIQPGSELSALIGNRRYDSLPRVALFGPTSRATRLTASGGTIVAAGLSALGWAGIVGRSAAALGDRVVAAADVFDGRLVAALADALADAPAEEIANRIDAVLGTTAPAPCPDEPLVVGLTAIIAEGSMSIANAAGRQLGVASHVVRRSALRHFGYPPKVLLNRRRFVDALEQMILSGRGYSEAARHGYFDASHFIRDAKRFLGMTPRRFLALAA